MKARKKTKKAAPKLVARSKARRREPKPYLLHRLGLRGRLLLLRERLEDRLGRAA